MVWLVSFEFARSMELPVTSIIKIDFIKTSLKLVVYEIV